MTATIHKRTLASSRTSRCNTLCITVALLLPSASLCLIVIPITAWSFLLCIDVGLNKKSGIMVWEWAKIMTCCYFTCGLRSGHSRHELQSRIDLPHIIYTESFTQYFELRLRSTCVLRVLTMNCDQELLVSRKSHTSGLILCDSSCNQGLPASYSLSFSTSPSQLWAICL